MNYLAHLSLSHCNSEVMLGNFIGDFVKGSNYSRYSPRVQTGILLHRKIDVFTDNHELVKASAVLFRESYGKYAGVIVDMIFDHFLASNWDKYYPEITLGKFVSRVHRILLLNYLRVPDGVKKMLPFLIKSRRLENYANMAGLARALNIMARNTSLPCNTKDAMACLDKNYELFYRYFSEFYPQIQSMVDEELEGVYADL